MSMKSARDESKVCPGRGEEPNGSDAERRLGVWNEQNFSEAMRNPRNRE